MSPIPTGRLLQTRRGRDLVLTRTFRAGIEEVWASVTEPERTARWFGRWEGDSGPGRSVRLTMGFEAGAEPCDVLIEECDPPRRLVVSLDDAAGAWLMAVDLIERDGSTELRLTHHLDDSADVASTGPGWEYYLDNLVAAHVGEPLPSWDDYYPAQKAHYEQLKPA